MNELRAFYRKYPTVKFSKGEIIVHQNEEPKYIYAIKSGTVKVSNIGVEGDDQLISFEIIDDILPICCAFSNSSKALFFYQAFTDCELYMTNKLAFMEQASLSVGFANAMLDRQVSSYVGSLLQVDALEKKRAHTKLLYTFRYLCLRYGRDVKKDLVKIHVPLTQQEIANMTGLTRETTTIELRVLKNLMVLSVRHKDYTINTELLNALINDEYDPGINMSMLTKVT